MKSGPDAVDAGIWHRVQQYYRRMDIGIDLMADFRVIRENYSRNEFLGFQQKANISYIKYIGYFLVQSRIREYDVA